MLKRVNKSVIVKVELRVGYAWIILRHNQDCTNDWCEKEKVIVYVYANNSNLDSAIMQKLSFDSYRKFKEFKNLVKSSVY